MSDIIFIKCKICNIEFNSYKSLANHLKIHKISSKKYYDDFIKHEEDGKCLICNNNTTFFNLSHGYRKFCSHRCSTISKETQNKIKNTCLEKYGFDSASKSESIKNKIKNTCLKKYGYIASSMSNEVKDKRKQTCLKLFNAENYSCTEECKSKKKKTIRLHYNTDFYSQSEEYKEYRKNKTLLDIKQYLKTGKIINYNSLKDVYYFCNICRSYSNINYSTFVQRLRYYNTNPCIICNPIEKPISLLEKELLNYIKTIYNKEIIENDRIILNGKELDIYLPDIKLAIEFNGTYWHADSRFYDENDNIREKTVKEIWENDKNKILMCNNKNIKLIQIKEYDWINNTETEKELIKTIILNRGNYE